MQRCLEDGLRDVGFRGIVCMSAEQPAEGTKYIPWARQCHLRRLSHATLATFQRGYGTLCKQTLERTSLHVVGVFFLLFDLSFSLGLFPTT